MTLGKASGQAILSNLSQKSLWPVYCHQVKCLAMLHATFPGVTLVDVFPCPLPFQSQLSRLTGQTLAHSTLWYPQLLLLWSESCSLDSPLPAAQSEPQAADLLHLVWALVCEMRARSVPTLGHLYFHPEIDEALSSYLSLSSKLPSASSLSVLRASQVPGLSNRKLGGIVGRDYGAEDTDISCHGSILRRREKTDLEDTALHSILQPTSQRAAGRKAGSFVPLTNNPVLLQNNACLCLWGCSHLPRALKWPTSTTQMLHPHRYCPSLTLVPLTQFMRSWWKGGRTGK